MADRPDRPVGQPGAHRSGRRGTDPDRGRREGGADLRRSAFLPRLPAPQGQERPGRRGHRAAHLPRHRRSLLARGPRRRGGAEGRRSPPPAPTCPPGPTRRRRCRPAAASGSQPASSPSTPSTAQPQVRPAVSGSAARSRSAARWSAAPASRRSRSITRGRASHARSTSSSVVDQPTDSRRLRSASTPMASSTGDGSSDSDEQALPEWAATPAWSRPSSTASASTPSTPRQTRWGSRLDRRRPVRPDARDGQGGGQQPVGLGPGPRRLGGQRAAAEHRGRGAEADPGGHVLHARPPGPLLLAADAGAAGAAGPAARAAPRRPSGRPACGPTPTAGRRRARRSRSARARRRRRRRRGPGRPAPGRPPTTSATGCRVPTSWLAHWQWTSAVSGPMASSNCVGVDAALAGRRRRR